MMIRQTLTLICTLMLCSSAIGQELVLISQKVCQPCRAAKKLLENLKDDEALKGYTVRELDSVADRTQIESLGIGRVDRVPVLVKLGVDGETISSISDLSEPSLKAFAADKPAKIDGPIALEQFFETVEAPSAFGAGPRIITYDIATLYRDGHYNPTFPWNDIEYAMDSLGRYWNVDYVRVSRGGQWHIIQGNTVGGPGWAAWTRGSNTYVSPVFRFANATQARMTIVHERGHVGGRGHHNFVGGLMHPNGGYKLLPQDQSYFTSSPFKGKLRPEQEPDWFKNYLSKGVQGVFGENGYEEFPLLDIQAK